MAAEQGGADRGSRPGTARTGSLAAATVRIAPHFSERLVAMCASALFSGLNEKQCSEIIACAHARDYVRDELLFAQGQPVSNLILLQSGTVKHTQLSESGEEVLLWMSGSGDPLNVQMNPRCGHTCSARALERCRALVWEYHRLQTLLAQYPQLANNISQILAGRLHELEERFREIATEKVAKRLASTLLRLLKRVGKPTATGVELSLSREELAQMVGTTLFTISRLVSRWAEEGFVVPGRQSVIVKDVKKLESIRDQEAAPGE